MVSHNHKTDLTSLEELTSAMDLCTQLNTIADDTDFMPVPVPGVPIGHVVTVLTMPLSLVLPLLLRLVQRFAGER